MEITLKTTLIRVKIGKIASNARGRARKPLLLEREKK